ncbi:FAD-dependent oxidoreductase [Rhizobium oryzicola]|uniref:FAD-dependent oxidoreductase n=1 Tax=Rhizobium oryzicola TaxID=1232668 RepID=A0ABT8SXS1_9HYPH|nr:FAD-dependent oxidoreductase [Rhizobium oryzicola]MDO1583228.1 FAD-dependent oxidoreductase [Rhizobium oryzicola]
MQASDPAALDGKLPAPESHVQVLVVGAGPAGLTAATELARNGVSVMLIDENPLDPHLVGLDVPLFFGGRAGSAVQNQARMVEQIVASDPAYEAAFEAGVDVGLGVTCWGVYLPGPASRALPGPVAALTDGARSWTVGFDRLLIAAGARDFVAFFDGADQPGVMGAQAFAALTDRYDAFDGRRLLVYGSGELGVRTAQRALDLGLEVAALVDVTDEPRAAPASINALRAKGVAIRTGVTVTAAARGALGVTSATLADRNGVTETFACDTICLALGRIPSIELFDSAGIEIVLEAGLGGYVPRSADGISTSSPLVFGLGDCIGVSEDLPSRADIEDEARRAAAIVMASLDGSPAVIGARTVPAQDQLAYRRHVIERMLESGGHEVLACQCEDVTRGDLAGIRPPRYLGCPASTGNRRDLKSHAAEGPLNHDQMKRLTRVSMGACQGRRCREQVALLMAIYGGMPSAAVPLAGYRPPVRPLPLSVLATMAETRAMADEWPVWFGIPTQWIPYGAIGTPEEDAMLATHMHL